MTDALAEELAECVARNEGLCASIIERGLPLRQTLLDLRAHHRAVLKDAHFAKVDALMAKVGRVR